jgi:hypothetical protein
MSTVIPDHNASDLSVYKMVLNRLPFLADTDTNAELISAFTMEVMMELETCFNIRITPETLVEDLARVGVEANYTLLQKMIVADIVAVYILMLEVTKATVGAVDDMGVPVTTPLTTFLKRAKAGSAEVEYGQFDISKGAGMSTSGMNLMTMYKKSAMRRARNLGCIIDICEDCTIAIESVMNIGLPFYIPSTGDCLGCGG